MFSAAAKGITNRPITTRATGPGVVTLFTRNDSKVILMLPLKLKTPATPSAKTSGACGLSKKDTDDGVLEVMSVMTCPPLGKKAKVCSL